MANRSRASYEAARLARRQLDEVGRELRIARVAAGLRQADVAGRIGRSTSQVSRVENAQARTLDLVSLSAHAAAVGLKPYVRLYPLGTRLLDGPQIELLARLRRRLHPAWSWETEVPMPIPGDLRSGDCRIAITGCAVLVEAFTRLSDFQAQTAAAARKKRDLGADRLVVLLADTNANRRAAKEARVVADGSFPLGTRAVLVALAAGRDPGADAIAFL
jgi:transcriptional regulator with XRE-family HTH domain